MTIGENVPVLEPAHAARIEKALPELVDVVQQRREVAALTEALVREFDGRVPAGAVMRCVARCRDELRPLGLQAGLPDALEAMSRRRLRDRVGGSLERA